MFTFACASVAWEKHFPECFGSLLGSSRRMTEVTDGRSRLGTTARYRLPAEIALSTNPAGRYRIFCFARAAEPPPRAATYTVRFYSALLLSRVPNCEEATMGLFSKDIKNLEEISTSTACRTSITPKTRS